MRRLFEWVKGHWGKLALGMACLMLLLSAGAWAGMREAPNGYKIIGDVISAGGLHAVTTTAYGLNGVVGQQTGEESSTPDGYGLWHGVLGPILIGSSADAHGTRAFWYFKYMPGEISRITVQIFNDGGTVTDLALEETVPAGWTFHGVVSANPPGTVPAIGATGTLRFDWGSSVPAFPVTLTYELSIPAGQTGDKGFSGQVVLQRGGGDLRADVGPLATISQRVYHSSDYNTPNYKIALPELLRLIQFYNSTGYHVDASTSDGFGPGAGDQTGAPHDSDYNPQNWKIGLPELLRLIQFYNSGGYHVQGATADGFAPGL